MSPAAAVSLLEEFRAVQNGLRNLPYSSEATYSIAGNPIRFQFGSERLRERISPALRHLEIAEECASALTVLVHNHATAPGSAGFAPALDRPGGENDIWLAENADLLVILQKQGRVVTALDRRANTAYWLVPDAASISYLERAQPLRPLFIHWLNGRRRYLVHGAAVGNQSGGVLILGHGGSGKSTTALVCLEDGLSYVADDHCLVSLETSPAVHSLCGTGKIAAADLDRFPPLTSAGDMCGRAPGDKVVCFFDRLPAVRLASGLPLRAILLAHINGSPRTTLRPAGKAAAFKAIAASSVLHLPADRPQALQCFGALVRQLPSYVLELGRDLRSSPVVIRELLDNLAV